MSEPVANELSATEWIAGLRAARREVIEALQHRIRNGLGSALGGRSDVGDADLDDFTQEAVLRVLEKADTFRGESAFPTWAMAVAIRISLTALRRRRWAARPLDEHDSEIESPSRDDISTSARQELFTALRRAIAEELTERQRQVMLSELEGVPQVVLADRLSATPGAIYKASHDARKKLKSVLARDGFDERTVLELLAKE